MKKIILVAFLGVLLVAFSACEKKSGENDKAQTEGKSLPEKKAEEVKGQVEDAMKKAEKKTKKALGKKACIPGVEQLCLSDEREKGKKTCKEDGSGWSRCEPLKKEEEAEEKAKE